MLWNQNIHKNNHIQIHEIHSATAAAATLVANIHTIFYLRKGKDSSRTQLIPYSIQEIILILLVE